MPLLPTPPDTVPSGWKRPGAERKWIAIIREGKMVTTSLDSSLRMIKRRRLRWRPKGQPDHGKQKGKHEQRKQTLTSTQRMVQAPFTSVPGEQRSTHGHSSFLPRSSVEKR